MHELDDERAKQDVRMAGNEGGPSIVQLNIGGKVFTTSLATLQSAPNTMLSCMFSGRHSPNKDGSFFIDRDGTHFQWILNYLRDCESIKLLQDISILGPLLLEARFYCIEPLVRYIEEKMYRKSARVLHISTLDNDLSPSDEKLLQENPDMKLQTVGSEDDKKLRELDSSAFNTILVTEITHW